MSSYTVKASKNSSMSAIQKMLLKNIDQEIKLILIKKKQYDLDSFVRGYHVYMGIWKTKIGDENFCLQSEDENQLDKFSCYCTGRTNSWACS